MAIESWAGSGRAAIATLAAWALLQVASAAFAQPEPASAIERMNQPGPEARGLAARAGDWDTTVTIWPAPGAAPIVTRDLIARRRMVGQFLEERLAPRTPSPGSDFQRNSYLHFNRVEGRWQYVSIDTRFPAGIMPASSIGRGTTDRIDLEFEPIAFPGWGESVEGWLMRSSYSVTGIGTDHEIARQEWTRSDGTGRRWVAVQFDYRRRDTAAAPGP